MKEYICIDAGDGIILKAGDLIRCKDCLFNDGDGPNEDGKYWCVIYQAFMQYCSEAERKEE